MLTKRNPKQEGSPVFDCRPQTGLCPNNCSQCFYNRPNAFYNNIDQPSIPSPEEVGTGIVRMNCGHDSNIQRELVIETAKQYEKVFFNTSIPNLDFPGPVVLTANPKEEEEPMSPYSMDWPNERTEETVKNVMFVRFRVSPTNLHLVSSGIRNWIAFGVPCVLTFMAYYDQEPPGCEKDQLSGNYYFKTFSEHSCPMKCYTWQQRHINSYYCATEGFMEYVTMKMKKMGGRLVSRCGTTGSRYCKACHNCEAYYYQTVKHLRESLHWSRYEEGDIL